MLREAYWLLKEGIADVAEIDRVMTSGLAIAAWSVIGPFRDLRPQSRGGLADHASRMAYRNFEMAQDLGTPEPWSEALVGEAVRQRREILPLEDWEARVGWRDRALMDILRARRTAAGVRLMPADEGGQGLCPVARARWLEVIPHLQQLQARA